MTETATTLPTRGPADMGLAARLLGVLFSPRATYAAVAERPRWLGALAACALVVIASQYAFMSSDIGRELVLEQQIRAMEAFGMTVTDEMYDQVAERIERTGYYGLIATPIYLVVVNAMLAGLLLGVFTMLLGGSGTFKQLYAVLAHSGVIIAVQQLFSTPLSLASEQMAGANLGVFAPMLEETSFVALLLGAIDLFLVWWMVNLAIGIGVLYKRRTTPIAIGLLTIYALIALVMAAVRSGS